LPPVEGPERQRFIEAAKVDFQDYAMIGDAKATLENGILRLEIDLRPPSA
jgi:HSP20 family molecular chaperone IbpA